MGSILLTCTCNLTGDHEFDVKANITVTEFQIMMKCLRCGAEKIFNIQRTA